MPRPLTRASLVVMAAAIATATGSIARADDAAPGEAWKSSPFHGTINGATGKAIPCVCRYQGRDFRLGASVCMQTHVGVVIAKCDMLLNNTTWAPTDQACTLSWRTPALPRG